MYNTSTFILIIKHYWRKEIRIVRIIVIEHLNSKSSHTGGPTVHTYLPFFVIRTTYNSREIERLSLSFVFRFNLSCSLFLYFLLFSFLSYRSNGRNATLRFRVLISNELNDRLLRISMPVAAYSKHRDNLARYKFEAETRVKTATCSLLCRYAT